MLTADSLMAQMRGAARWANSTEPFGGVRIVSDPNALKATAERLFPVSRHRSRRTLKKLVKRHGGEYRMAPAMYQLTPSLIVAHPALYEAVRRATTPQR